MFEEFRNRSIFENIEWISAALVAGLFLIDQKLVIVLILALGLNALVWGFLKGFQWPALRFSPFILLFLFYVVGLLFTTNFDYGGQDIETRLTFLLFPLFFAGVKRQKPIPITWVVWAFMSGALIYMILRWQYAGECALHERERFCYESYKLSGWIHPTYVALYLIAGAAFITVNAFQRQKAYLLKSLALALSLISLFFVYQLYSLGPWIAFVAMITCLGFAFFYKRKQLIYFLGGLILFVIGGIMAIQNLDLLRSDFDAVSTELTAYSNDKEGYIKANQNNTESVKARLIIWNASYDFIREHPFGVGTGDRKDELQNYYISNGMQTFADKELNPHSQYFQTAMSIGIFSALFLIFSFFYYTWLGIKYHNFYLIALVTLFSVACLFESVLERQWGILFFMFFLSVFLTSIPNRKQRA